MLGWLSSRVIAMGMAMSCLMSGPLMAQPMGAGLSEATPLAQFTGVEIILESLRRHELYPHVYEEQTLVLTDAKGNRDVRRIKRYSRLGHDGGFKAMIKFSHPESIAGSSLMFTRQRNGMRNSQFYLPALKLPFIDYSGGVAGSQMLGSEFSLEDLMPEDVQAFAYQRMDDVVDGEVSYFVVRAVSNDIPDIRRTYHMRKILIRQDNFFITHIDYLDGKGALLKRQTRHDIRRVNGKLWRADMLVMENYSNHYRSILKIDRRVYSRDYVPESIFEWSLSPVNQATVIETTAEKPAAVIQTIDSERMNP